MTPIKLVGQDNHSHAIFECMCECGNIVKIIGNSLKTGNTTTCGCQSRKRGKNHALFMGYEEISSSMWSSINHHASKRNIDVKLTIKQAWKQFIKQGRRCALSGIILTFAPTRKTANQSTASLDRINSKGIYKPSNIQWLHKDLNRMKWSLSQEEFVAWCKLVTNNN